MAKSPVLMLPSTSVAAASNRPPAPTFTPRPKRRSLSCGRVSPTRLPSSELAPGARHEQSERPVCAEFHPLSGNDGSGRGREANPQTTVCEGLRIDDAHLREGRELRRLCLDSIASGTIDQHRGHAVGLCTAAADDEARAGAGDGDVPHRHGPVGRELHRAEGLRGRRSLHDRLRRAATQECERPVDAQGCAMATAREGEDAAFGPAHRGCGQGGGVGPAAVACRVAVGPNVEDGALISRRACPQRCLVGPVGAGRAGLTDGQAAARQRQLARSTGRRRRRRAEGHAFAHRPLPLLRAVDLRKGWSAQPCARRKAGSIKEHARAVGLRSSARLRGADGTCGCGPAGGLDQAAA